MNVPSAEADASSDLARPDSTPAAVTLDDIRRARERIVNLACRTPLKPSYTLSRLAGRQIRLKLETAQATGAFKLRGAANAVLRLPDDARRRGVVTMSSGNHGRALAYVARALGIRAVICVSEQVPPAKLEGMRSLGAEVIVHGPDQDVADAHAHRLEQEQGLTYVSPFDHPDVIAGQGTIGLELLEEFPELDTLVVPVSGGGLVSGIAVAVHALKPAVRVLGVSQALGPAMYDSLRAGKPVDVVEEPSLADALQGTIYLDNRHTFRLCREHLEEIFLLDEEAIARAMTYAFRHERLVLEGGAAVAVGVVLDEALRSRLGENVAVICTGDNVAPDKLLDVVRRHADV